MNSLQTSTNPTAPLVNKNENYNERESLSRLNLVLPDISIISNIEKYFSEINKDISESESYRITLDFSQCSFVEVTSLVYIIAFIKKQLRSGSTVTLSLPKKGKLLDFLVVWEFLERLGEIVGYDVGDLVDRETRAVYENRKHASNLNYADLQFISGQEIRVLSKKFFSLNAFRLGRQENSYLINDVTKNWQQDNILRVLSRNLRVPEASIDLPSRIIFEAVANSTWHPNADWILTASRFEGQGQNKQFTIVIWDDGESIVETLRKGFEKGETGNPIRPLFRSYRKYILKTENRNLAKSQPNVLQGNYDIRREDPDEILFLASTFFGVTGKLGRRAQDVGTGLTSLTNFAIDICGGTVSFRIRNLFMNIKRLSSKKTKMESSENENEKDYEVKIVRYGDSTPDFLGNMITIRLPLL